MQPTPPPMKMQPMKIQPSRQPMNMQSPPPMPFAGGMGEQNYQPEQKYQPLNDSKPFSTQPVPYGDGAPTNFQQPQSPSNQSFAKRNLIKPPKSDIQDKNNRKCSSCCITFESRRLFISHCTVDHNMKFRTASGVTINNSTFGQGNNQLSQER